MIKFFRHIRQSLIGQNKMGKYFKYAIGEIILVVLGILLALQINNWNEERKERAKGLNYIGEIHVDLLSLKTNIENKVTRLSNQNRGVTSLLKAMEGITTAEFTPDSMELAIIHSYTPVNLQRRKNTWDDLSSTGKLGMLRDKALIDQLEIFFSKYELDILNFGEVPMIALREFQRQMLQGNSYNDFYHRDQRSQTEREAQMKRMLNDEYLHLRLREIMVGGQVLVDNFEKQMIPELEKIISYIADKYPNTIKTHVGF